MTYTAGSNIVVTDYNGFLTPPNGGNPAINDIWFRHDGGVPSSGWGQTALTVRSVGDQVTAAQWASLVNTLTSMGSQTGTTITSRSAPVAGNNINILSEVLTDITTCNTNRGNAVSSGSQYTGWTGTNSRTADWNPASPGPTSVLRFTNTITFPSADQARYFWNAGGLVKIQVSKTSTGNTGDPEWNDLASTLCGAIWVSGRVNAAAQTIAGTSYSGVKQVGGTGTPTTLSTTHGWFALSSGPGNAIIVYKQFADTAPYTSNYIQHSLNRNTSLTTLTIVTDWANVDGDTITGGTAASGATPGTAPCTIVTYYPPSTTYLTNSWGTPTVAATTITA